MRIFQAHLRCASCRCRTHHVRYACLFSRGYYHCQQCGRRHGHSLWPIALGVLVTLGLLYFLGLLA